MKGGYNVAQFLSFLCSAGAGFLLTDRLLADGAFYMQVPPFSATAAALIGLLIAGMEYRAAKTKKKRRLPMALLIFNALIGIAATGIWLYTLL